MKAVNNDEFILIKLMSIHLVSFTLSILSETILNIGKNMEDFCLENKWFFL